ncbi:MAG: hypothetical protein M3Z54_03110 [Gemmatimonadota bacterium]|nr:hypothetical protein [Gemmatimonadota bacterium]
MSDEVSPLAQAVAVAKGVEIQHVSLQAATLRTQIDPLELPEEVVLSQSHRTRYELPEKHPGKIFVTVEFDCNGAGGPPSGDTQRLKLSAIYLLIYSHPDLTSLPAESLEAFARLNGVYNAWPYWRELIQTVSGRIGLGPLVVPVFRATAGGTAAGTAKATATAGD